MNFINLLKYETAKFASQRWKLFVPGCILSFNHRKNMKFANRLPENIVKFIKCLKILEIHQQYVSENLDNFQSDLGERNLVNLSWHENEKSANWSGKYQDIFIIGCHSILLLENNVKFIYRLCEKLQYNFKFISVNAIH